MIKSSQNNIISKKDLVGLVSIIISNWYIILIFPLFAFALSYLYTHRIPVIYAAKCQILLKSNETYDYQQSLYKGLGFGSKYASYEETASQMRVITSSNLIAGVLELIPLKISYYIVGRLKVTQVYRHLPFRVISDERSSMPSGMAFNLKIIDENFFRLTYDYRGKSVSRKFQFDELIMDDDLYLKIARQPNLNEVSITTLSEIDYLFKVFKTQDLINKYKSNIAVENLDFTSIVEITLKDQIPDRAREILEVLAELYVKQTMLNQNEINSNTLNYIDKQLVEVVSIINEIEFERESYKEDKEILNLSREEEAYFNRLFEFENQARKDQFQLQSIEDLISYLLLNEDVESLLPPSMFVSETDPELKTRVIELYELRAQFKSLSVSGTEENPMIETLMKRINSQKKDILSYLDSQKNAIKEIQKLGQIEIASYEAKIKNIPKKQRQLLNIERRLQVNEELYSFLLSKRAETVIAKAGLVPETKVIENARPIGVVYPDKQRMNLINLLVGLGVAVLIVLVRVYFFRKIQSLGQLQAETSISILGSIPKKKDFSKTYRILSGNEKSDLVQAFRALRTNLQYFLMNKKSVRVLVTSLMPGEGKTFTSVNLASVFAIAEKRVLIIDFDLHKPRLARAMEVDNSKGVTSYLAGLHSVEQIIQKSEIPHLDIISSGPVPPNASELILRNEISSILDYADSNYDYIFIDTPPIALITDGLYLMRKADVKLFVMNSKSTTSTSVDFLEHLIEENQIENCALILNEEKLSRMNYYYSRYGYGGYGYGGYGYGYGYGYQTYGEDAEK